MFNLLQAIKLAHYSEIVYKPYSPMVRAIKELEGGELVAEKDWIYIEVKDTQLLVINPPKINDVYIIFRGTSSLADGKTDIKCRIIDTRYGGIHQGIYEAYDVVGAELEQYINNYVIKNPKAQLWIGGHSLGGGLAIRCALSMPQENIAGVYTFGAMRVLDIGSRNHYDNMLGLKHRTWRFVHGCDIVPNFPTKWQGFRHPGNLAYIDTQGRIWDDELDGKKAQWQMKTDRLFDGFRNALRLRLVRKGHEIGRYREALEHAKG